MNWRLKPKAPKGFLRRFPQFSPLAVQLLYNRGLRTQQQIDEFFNPDFDKDLPSPYLFKDMKKAVKRIVKALNQKEKILIYGDFDTDGVCASAILYQTLKQLGGQELEVYIPDREKENHGLNRASLGWAKKNKTDLIITVDCASTDLKEAALAKNLGIDLIITDHHEMGDKKPAAEAIINPYQKGQRYPFQQLSGAGVAYKLSWALLDEMGDSENLKKWLLDLTALATVADVMPIIGENRTIVKYGLGVLAQTRWVGLRELMKAAGIKPEVIGFSAQGEAPASNLDTYTLAYLLGPRLNAPGRIKRASLAFELLTAQEPALAREIALEINQQNLKRQYLAEKLFSELEACLAEYQDIPPVIFEGSEDWPIGIVGLIASKAAEKYQRPIVLYCQNGKEICASVRANPQLDLVEVLDGCAAYFNEYGGRRGAGGFRMSKDKGKLEQVKKDFNRLAAQHLKGIDLSPALEVEAELALNEMSFENYEQIQRFAPFGKGNPDPIFLARGLEALDARLVGNGQKHLKMELLMFGEGQVNPRPIKAIGFGLSNLYEEVKPGNLVDLVFKMDLNHWNGFKNLEMKVVDLKPANQLSEL